MERLALSILLLFVPLLATLGCNKPRPKPDFHLGELVRVKLDDSQVMVVDMVCDLRPGGGGRWRVECRTPISGQIVKFRSFELEKVPVERMLP